MAISVNSIKKRHILLLFFAVFINSKGDDSYRNVKALQDRLLSPSRYSATIRPKRNQTEPIIVETHFALVAIVAVNDVAQELITNGFIFLFWKDEITRWNRSDYSGFKRLSPEPKQIWRPRLMVLNLVDNREAFHDELSHTFFPHDGEMAYAPGGLFKTYCALNMLKFPFDIQICKIQIFPIGLSVPYLQFVSRGDTNLAFFYPNPGWDLLDTKTIIENITVVPAEIFSSPTFIFKLKRRPTTIVLNVILPVIVISMLNNMVFLIPGDSGEKISYAVSVLMSQSVFLSMVSTMTPQVSDSVPALTYYLFVLLLTSVFTVAATIFTVYQHHKKEKEDTLMKMKAEYQQAVNKIINMRTAVTALEHARTRGSFSPTNDKIKPSVSQHNKYRMISKHIDKVFFFLITSVWLVMTLWYFIFANL